MFVSMWMTFVCACAYEAWEKCSLGQDPVVWIISDWLTLSIVVCVNIGRDKKKSKIWGRMPKIKLNKKKEQQVPVRWLKNVQTEPVDFFFSFPLGCHTRCPAIHTWPGKKNCRSQRCRQTQPESKFLLRFTVGIQVKCFFSSRNQGRQQDFQENK